MITDPASVRVLAFGGPIGIAALNKRQRVPEKVNCRESTVLRRILKGRWRLAHDSGKPPSQLMPRQGNKQQAWKGHCLGCRYGRVVRGLIRLLSSSVVNLQLHIACDLL